MIKLLRAEFARCFTGKLFWLVVLFNVVLASSFNVLTYATTKSGDFSNVFTDKTLYIGLISMGLTAAVFVAFHAGSEFDIERFISKNVTKVSTFSSSIR